MKLEAFWTGANMKLEASWTGGNMKLEASWTGANMHVVSQLMVFFSRTWQIILGSKSKQSGFSNC